MAKYYTREKAKFGGITGLIMPFMIKLPDVNIPDQAEWKQFLPAGYLRCDGSILSADVYPELAAVLGTGRNCKFAKDPDVLNDNQFQLPDLGSKYIRCANSSGQYLNTTLDQDQETLKVGAETIVQSLVGDSVTIRYGGNFTVIGDEFNFGGNPLYTTSTGNTLNSPLSEENFQAHGHDADVGVFTYLGNWVDSNFNLFTGGGKGANDAQTEGSNVTVTIQPPDNAPFTVNHTHGIQLPSSRDLKDNTSFKYQFFEAPIAADGLESEVIITTENVKKLDSAISPYMLVEFIIKI
jgi:microcystin-dependent protein